MTECDCNDILTESNQNCYLPADPFRFFVIGDWMDGDRFLEVRDFRDPFFLAVSAEMESSSAWIQLTIDESQSARRL